jgi:hypothetical protein
MMKKLNEIPGKNPFKVPENYFEEVNRKILSVTSGNDLKVKKSSFYYRFRTQLAVAASVAGFILLSYTAVKILTADKKDLLISEIAFSEDTESYINDIDLITIEENAALLDFTADSLEVSKNEIIDYLLLENIEISDIYEQQ